MQAACRYTCTRSRGKNRDDCSSTVQLAPTRLIRVEDLPEVDLWSDFLVLSTCQLQLPVSKTSSNVHRCYRLMFFLLACVGLGGRDSWPSDFSIGQSLDRTWRSGPQQSGAKKPSAAWTGMFPSSSRTRVCTKFGKRVECPDCGCHFAPSHPREQLRFNSGTASATNNSSETTNSHRYLRKGRRNSHRTRQRHSVTCQAREQCPRLVGEPRHKSNLAQSLPLCPSEKQLPSSLHQIGSVRILSLCLSSHLSDPVSLVTNNPRPAIRTP